MQAMTQLPIIMLCTDKRPTAQAHYRSEWTQLGYGMVCLFDSFVPRRLMKAQPLLCVDLAKRDKDQSYAKFITLLKY